MEAFITKTVFGLFIAISLLSGNGASAQVLSPQPYPFTCTTLIHGLAYGSRDSATGGEVTALQTFLSSQGLFSVTPTGFYGSITARAVANFQAARGIASIGIVGPLTRAAIAQASCNGGVVPPTQTTPVIYNIIPTSGPVGTTVSITGFGFTNDNTIHFGYGVVLHVPITSSIAVACTTDPSCRGGIRQTLTFTVPDTLNPACYYSNPRCMIASQMTQPGNYAISVENSSGTSNSMQFTVTSPQTAAPAINSISPSMGAIGTPVTLTGSNFTSDSILYFGNGYVTPSSNNGSVMTFVVPQYVSPYCASGMMCPMWVQQITPGTYSVSIKNSAGTSNSATFTVQ